MTITLSSSKDKITFAKKKNRKRKRRGRVRLAGHVDAGSCQPDEVLVRARRAGKDAFKDRRTVALDPDGSFALRLRPRRNASYVATVDAPGCDAAISSPVHVAVKVAINARSPKRCRPGAKIRGRVRPNHKKTVVLLQKKRKARKGWRDVAGDRLNRRSRFVVRAPSCKGRYRLVWKKQNVLNETGRKRLSLRDISINSSRSRVRKGRRVRLSGRIDGSRACEADQTVRLRAKRVNGGRFRTIKTTATDNEGDYSFRVKVRKSKRYFTVARRDGACEKAKSRRITVRARG